MFMPNTSFSDLKAANPYRNVEYKQSGWQRFLSALGFRTQADAFKENMAVQAAEYDAALAQKEFDTQYNDAQSQSERLRSAGLNPDLDPSMIDGGSAAPMGDDPSVPMQATGDEETIMEVGRSIISCFTSALGLVSGIQGISRNHLQNTLLGLDITENATGLFDSLKDSFVPAIGENTDMSPREYISDAFERAKLFSRKNLPKKFRGAFESAAENFFNSAPTEASAYKSWYDSINAQKGYYGAKNEFYAPDPEVMDAIYKHLGNIREQLTMMDYRKQGSESVRSTEEAEYQTSVIEGLNPDSASAAQNAENETKVIDRDIQKILKKEVDGLLRDLKKDTSPFASVFRTLLSAFSLYMFVK